MRNAAAALLCAATVARANLAAFDPSALLNAARSGETWVAAAAEAVASANGSANVVVAEHSREVNFDNVGALVVEWVEPFVVARLAALSALLALIIYIGRLCLAARRRAALRANAPLPIDLHLQRRLLRSFNSAAQQQ